MRQQRLKARAITEEHLPHSRIAAEPHRGGCSITWTHVILMCECTDLPILRTKSLAFAHVTVRQLKPVHHGSGSQVASERHVVIFATMKFSGPYPYSAQFPEKSGLMMLALSTLFLVCFVCELLPIECTAPGAWGQKHTI